MKSIYIDSDYKCHINNNGAMRAFEIIDFDGKCDEYIEGFCFIPSGESWVRHDGTVFHGEMLFPWKQYSILDIA